METLKAWRVIEMRREVVINCEVIKGAKTLWSWLYCQN